ncbi:N-acetylmuramic acid 6-phosphate etherase [candidate division KSB1 bacterium]|nr:MAG: N-acetylmuramic acid 6-phosphate etherase [candidate division KSB1 bacterium]
MPKSVFEQLQELTTESRNPDTMNLDTMSVREILEAMNREDSKVPVAVATALPQIEKAVELIVTALRSGGRLIYVGAGTSGRMGILDAAECPPTFSSEPWQVQGFISGGQEAVFKAVEGAEDDEVQAVKDLELCCLNTTDVMCGVTASRRTPYVISSLRHASERGCKRIFVICNDSPDDVADLADVVISVPVGPEVLTGSTRMKAGTATKLVLNMLTTASMVKLGKCYENLMVDLRAGSQKLRARSRRIFMELTGSDYEWADEVLKDANGELKTALVMHFRGVDADRARELLEENGGVVRKVIQS